MEQPKKIIPSTVVLEVLNKYNYEEWSGVVQSYLVAQGLWNVIEPDIEEPGQSRQERILLPFSRVPEPRTGYAKDENKNPEDDKSWKKDDMNAAALHAIKISCGPEALSAIKEIISAKEAWQTLADKFKQTIRIDLTDYSGEDKEDYWPFGTALGQGQWDTVKQLYTQNPDLLKARYFRTAYSTALHYAVAISKNDALVMDMVKQMTVEDLEIKETANGNTALALAVLTGTRSMIQDMIDKNKKLLEIADNYGNIPVVMALYYKRVDFFVTLYKETPLAVLSRDEGKQGATVISRCIKMKTSETIKSALDLLCKERSLAISKDNTGKSPMYILACAPSLFREGFELKFWERWIYDYTVDFLQKNVSSDKEGGNKEGINDHPSESDTTSKNSAPTPWIRWLVTKLVKLTGVDHERIKEMKLVEQHSTALLKEMSRAIENIKDKKKLIDGQVYEALCAAVDRGNIKFVDMLIRELPMLANSTDEHFRDINMRAIESRQAKLFQHLLSSGERSWYLSLASALEDKFGNNLLHIAGGLAPSTYLNRIPGAALQMQRELQWFEEVQKILPEAALTTVNTDGMTPREVFTKNHKDLVIKGEKWMKETATSCSVVAALIVTVVFAAAFTIPGDITSVELDKTLKISIGLSLFSSTASVVVFLGILTSRYQEDDFLISLPTKLIIGLSTLFFSIAAMLIAFCAILLIILPESWVPIPVILLAALPVTLFLVMQFPLLITIFKNTYGKGFSLTYDTKVTVIKKDN